MAKRIFLSLVLLLTTIVSTWAENVSYIYYTVNSDGKAITKHEDGSLANPTVLTSTLLKNSNEDNLDTGWYVLNTSFEYGERIVISGDVKLILKDGCTLTAEQGIRINSDATLTIYAQSETEGTMGKLVAIETHHDKAAIGGNKNYEAGRLFIHGGEIEAICKNGSKYAAGIGGGYGDGSGMKEITIYGGKVTAQGAKCGAGIGGGKNNNHAGTINIYGGDITANGGMYGAGIGGGENRAGWDTYLYNGKINATGGSCGAGIGGGNDGKGGNITIYGGRITANAKSEAAGIGGGSDQPGGNIEIFGGTIYAYGDFGAGIGGGAGESYSFVTYHGDAGIIKIHGGWVVGSSKSIGGGAGIGGGYYGNGGTIVIDGGHVEAVGNTVRETFDRSASIGRGAHGNNKGTVEITGDAYVKLTRISVDLGTQTATLIGAVLTLGNTLCVKENENSLPYNASERVDQCTVEQHSVLIIGPCTHDMTYTVSESGHEGHCKYCKHSETGEHTYIGENTTCSTCGYGTAVTITSLAFPQTSTASMSGYHTSNYDVVDGQTIALPDCNKVPVGWKFVGWSEKENLNGINDFTSIEAADSETDLHQPGDDYEVSGSAFFFARYRYDFTDTWDWADDLASATLTIKSDATDDIHVGASDINVSRTVTEATADAEGCITATATYTYTHDNTTYTFTDTQTMPLYYTLSLDEDDNTGKLASADGKTVTTALTGRTLYKDGSWNTLCLPFDMPIEGSPLDGATVKELVDAAFANGTLTLNFADVTKIRAGVPCLIKWDSSDTHLTGTDLVFEGVAIDQTANDEECAIGDNVSVTFMGTYKRLSFAADDRTVLYLGADNTLYYPQSGASIGAQRAYFKLSGLTAGDLATGASTFVLNFGDDETATGISLTPGPSPKGEGSDYYSLDGRKLPGKPTQKGIYINNGRKIVNK